MLAGVWSGFTPGQSILTPEGQNLSNAFNVELDTKLTSRSSLTFVGGYSLVRYFDNDLSNYGDATFQTPPLSNWIQTHIQDFTDVCGRVFPAPLFR